MFYPAIGASKNLGALVKSGSADVRICGCCIRIRAGISVRVRITVRDGVRISNRIRRRVKLVNYSLITALPFATSAHPLFTRGQNLVSEKYDTLDSCWRQSTGTGNWRQKTVECVITMSCLGWHTIKERKTESRVLGVNFDKMDLFNRRKLTICEASKNCIVIARDFSFDSVQLRVKIVIMNSIIITSLVENIM